VIFREVKNVIRLSFADLIYEKHAISYNVATLAVMLAPVLVLFALKFGVITALTERLMSNPLILSITPIGQSQFSHEWINNLKRKEGVSFVSPKIRYLSAEAYLENNNLEDGDRVRVELLPTGVGDPVTSLTRDVFYKMGEGVQGVFITHSAAEKLNATSGDTLIYSITRKVDGNSEQVQLPVYVTGVVPLLNFERDAIFMPVDLLFATEDYRSFIAVNKFGWRGAPSTNERSFSSFRLYAETLKDIRPLRDWLETQDVEVSTKLAEIEVVESIESNLNTLFFIIGGLALVGGALTVGVNTWGSVARKEHELSLLRLLGYSNTALVVFPVFQAVMISILGSIAGLLVYLSVEPIVNAMFSEKLLEGGVACILHPLHAVYAGLITVLISFIAAFGASVKVWSISPIDGIRQD